MTLNHKQQGFGLIEVLVSMLILSIGLLGIAGLQAQSIRFNNEAYLRTQATVLAGDIVDRMRTNRTAAIGTDNYKFALNDSPTANVTACETAACSAGNIAAYDFTQWRANIASALPNGLGAITPLARVGTFREYVIQISYNSVSIDTTSSLPTTITFDYRTRI
jgi:type IV pilus assembly protein PilV